MGRTVPETLIKTTLKIPESIYDRYAERSALQGHTTEAEINDRLRTCMFHTDSQAIYLTNSDRNELSQIAGQTIKTARELLDWALMISSFKVEGVTVPLDAQQIKRLDSRRFGKTWPQLMKDIVQQGVNAAVGL